MAVCAGSVVLADSGSADGCTPGCDGDNITWTYDTDTCTLTISGWGDMIGWSSGAAPWYGHHEEIKTVVISSGITSIGYSAFMNCTSLTSVTIPSTVTTIHTWAFIGCSSLESITLHSSITHIDGDAFVGTPDNITVYNWTSL